MSVVISPSFTAPLSVVAKLAAGIDDPSATTPASDFSNVNSAWSSVLAAVDFSRLQSSYAMQQHKTCFVDSFIVRSGQHRVLQKLVPHPEYRLQTHPPDHPIILTHPFCFLHGHALHDFSELFLRDSG
ncbi:hypothetical protein TSUD_375180 [Trifolium subterraneum]|uniref:Uncharacterized protein n=1 Tax=Trifolium subterraneum TaxID=3900 RepID=A0A2Z6MSK8_TRISU|nr:hypothetical protein TSUD_375180 [Trifolium subterraneum]